MDTPSHPTLNPLLAKFLAGKPTIASMGAGDRKGKIDKTKEEETLFLQIVSAILPLANIAVTPQEMSDDLANFIVCQIRQDKNVLENIRLVYRNWVKHIDEHNKQFPVDSKERIKGFPHIRAAVCIQGYMRAAALKLGVSQEVVNGMIKKYGENG